jgi:DNA-binding transcriptional LysR family regulator
VAPFNALAGIELRYLAALRAVERTGTFGAAATELGYAQSTLSHQIAALERAVGGALFDRPGGPRPVTITPLGKVVLQQAHVLLADAEAATAAIERFRAGEGRLDIGTFQTASSAILPAVLGKLLDERPVDVRLVEEGPAVERLLSGQLDLLFWDVRFWNGRSDVQIAHRKLLEDPFVLVARRDAFPQATVPLERLDGVPIVAHPNLDDQPALVMTLEALGVAPTVVFRASDNATVVSMVRAGLGCALMPRLAAQLTAPDAGLRIHETVPRLPPREIFVAWLAGRTLSPAAERVLAISGEVAARLSET